MPDKLSKQKAQLRKRLARTPKPEHADVSLATPEAVALCSAVLGKLGLTELVADRVAQSAADAVARSLLVLDAEELDPADESERILLAREFIKVLCSSTLRDEVALALLESVSTRRFKLWRSPLRAVLSPDRSSDPGSYLDPLAWELPDLPSVDSVDPRVARLGHVIEGMMKQEQGMTDAHVSVVHATRLAVERRAEAGIEPPAWRPSDREALRPVPKPAEPPAEPPAERPVRAWQRTEGR